MKQILWIVGIVVGLALTSVNCFAEQNKNASQTYICRQPFALCTTAPCTPVPGSKDQSVCSCIVQDGPSMGKVACEKRKPSVNDKGQHLLTSNFSFVNAKTNRIMVCTGNHAWTDCLDKPCIIDPQNSNQASCMCDIKISNSFITFGGQCQTASCTTTLYSGATTDMLDLSIQTFVNYLHLSKSPMQYCSSS